MDHIQSIKAFVTVVRLESFTRAARQLNVSLAALSRAVSNLESHTQTRLVNRTSRFVSLAPGAREYFDICVEVLDRLFEGEQRLLVDRDEPRGVLRIAAHPIAIEAGLPQAITAYRYAAPKVEVVLNVRTNYLRLGQDSIDVAVYPPDMVLDADVICRRILHSPILLVASLAYLTQREFDCTRLDLSGHVILSCADEIKADRVLRVDRGDSVMTLTPGSVRMSVGESAAIQLALSGFGMALLPECLAAPYLASDKLRLVFPGCQLVGETAALGVAYLRYGTVPHRIRSFVDTCTRFFGVDGKAKVQPAFDLVA
ncbi:LysR family transcriptional regulator [Paraburkholderia nodosa]|uniref:LysR family transcriptional regulator n=1 Tax=Paraburkholderia nodosa TaxID=392320 RepID=UPI000480B5EF|nr:LysR family transcriptional regulator [Paraburkholderia nodosa]